MSPKGSKKRKKGVLGAWPRRTSPHRSEYYCVSTKSLKVQSIFSGDVLFTNIEEKINNGQSVKEYCSIIKNVKKLRSSFVIKYIFT